MNIKPLNPAQDIRKMARAIKDEVEFQISKWNTYNFPNNLTGLKVRVIDQSVTAIRFGVYDPEDNSRKEKVYEVRIRKLGNRYPDA